MIYSFNSVKHEQNIDCGGGYLKIFDCGLDQTKLHGDSPYLIMFGPEDEKNLVEFQLVTMSLKISIF